MSVYPNPASAITCIPVNCVESFEGQINLINVLGKEVTTIYEGNFLSGLNQFFIHANNYAKGMYFIVLDSEQGKITKKACDSIIGLPSYGLNRVNFDADNGTIPEIIPIIADTLKPKAIFSRVKSIEKSKKLDTN